MHNIVIEEMERHLAGRASVAFYEHLAECEGCRRETGIMQETSELLRAFRANPEEALGALPGFYGRVAAGIVQQQSSSGWGIFAPNAIFFRRVAFASLLLLAGFGSYLITNEPEFSVNDTTAIIARQSATDGSPATSAQRDRILLTLANWSE
jgi:hypothetical protein